jgi:hypothetical protein
MHQCAPAVSRLCFQAPPPFPGHLAPLTLNTEALQPTYTLSLLPTPSPYCLPTSSHASMQAWVLCRCEC